LAAGYCRENRCRRRQEQRGGTGQNNFQMLHFDLQVLFQCSLKAIAQEKGFLMVPVSSGAITGCVGSLIDTAMVRLSFFGFIFLL